MTDVDKYLAQRNQLDRDMHEALIEELKNLTDRYQIVFGNSEGVNQLGEDLCRRVASYRWSEIVCHLNKISG